MRFKPSKALRSLRLRGAIAAAIAVVGFAGLAIAQTTPALADPTVTLVAVGSDTIQDVYNQFGTDVGGNLLGSYNAVNPVTAVAHEVITPADGTASVNCSFARPNGSGEGVGALRLSINPASTLGLAAAPSPQPKAGCVDIGRSSSGPGGNASTTGPLVYIPFALDAVGGATGPANCTGTPNPCAPYTYTYTSLAGPQGSVTATPVPTAITTANDFTINDLKTMYASCGQVTEGGITYWPFETGVTQPAGTQRIDLYVPQPGSGTLSFWASTLGFSSTSLPACVFQNIQNGALAGQSPLVPVEEHNGTPMATDPDGFGPFSIAQWVSQSHGHDDRRHTAVIHSLAPCSSSTSCQAAVSPFTAGGALNVNFPVTRSVYSVVSFARVSNSSDPLFALLNGTGSFECSDQLSILSYGFALLPAADGTCGEVIASNRALG
jgi:phosphate transport system substrate-binding protein